MEIIYEYLPIVISTIFSVTLFLISKSIKYHSTIVPGRSPDSELDDSVDCLTPTLKDLKPLGCVSQPSLPATSETSRPLVSGSKETMADEFSYDCGFGIFNSGDFIDRDECDYTEPIPLLEDVEGKLVFQVKNLRKLLDPVALKGKEVAIVSIAGALRMGKSFLLNLMLRYLTEEGWKNNGWLKDWDSSKDRGLKWRGGSDAHTRGIVAWGKPIFVEGSGGKEIAVILLDTQGNFEHGRSMEENVSVFALSTLFSSMQIFNVKNQIQANDLDYLQCFVEFAKTACEIPYENKSQANIDSGEDEIYRPQFQHLTYLVRDWPYPVDFDYGDKGGMKYLETFLSGRKGTEEQNEVQKYLRKTFKPIGCFLMPEPGQKIRISNVKNRNLTAGDLGKDFTDSLILFADTYLHPNKITTKRILRTSHATAEELLHHMEACADALLNNNVLQIPNLMKLVAERTNAIAMDRAEKGFIAHMEEGIENMDNPSWDDFESLAQKEEQISVEEFLYNTQYGKGEYQDEGKQRLIDQLRLRKSELKSRMHSKRTAHVKKVTNRWLDESLTKLTTHRGYFYTTSTDYDQIKNDCKAQLLKKDKKDHQSVADLLEDANKRLDAMANDVIRAEKENNSKRLWSAVKAVGVGAAVATPAAGAVYLLGSAFAIGSTVLATSVAGGGTGVTGAGIYLKRKLDEVWNNGLWKKKNV